MARRVGSGAGTLMRLGARRVPALASGSAALLTRPMALSNPMVLAPTARFLADQAGSLLTDAELEGAAARDDGSFFAENNISLDGDLSGVNTSPLVSFDDVVREGGDGARSPLPSKVRQFFRSKGYEQPTPIQAASLPLSLAGKDTVAIAQTGSGKTMAFLLPLLWNAMEQRKQDSGKQPTRGPLALVLAPTRELAQQIAEEAVPLAQAFGARITCVFGGQAKHYQEHDILRQVSQPVPPISPICHPQFLTHLSHTLTPPFESLSPPLFPGPAPVSIW